MECTENMLAAAMAKAVQVGLLPKQAPSEEYLKNWSNMKAILEAALEAANNG
jgi:hypothetical protein